MLVRRISDDDVPEVSGPGWSSRRPILRDHGFGYSVHHTTLEPGTTLELQYLHHIETVYCIHGEGTLTDHATGTVHDLRPGVLYVLDNNDRHTLSARTRLEGLCIFTPPTTGGETHTPDGSYPFNNV